MSFFGDEEKRSMVPISAIMARRIIKEEIKVYDGKSKDMMERGMVKKELL
ncbi:MAG: hypothetical protein HYW01_02540 [Deltaproteobacteria bacterium]|nr:hypothetical protein [Deltaproteobacteria bacterium]